MSKIIFLALYIFLVICIEQSDDKLFANAEKEYDIVIKDSNLIIEEYISGLDLPVMIDFIDEVKDYLLNFINNYFDFNLKTDNIISSFSGVRPLYSKNNQK